MDEGQRLRPYVARLALEWLREAPQQTHRRIDGTLAFVDVSGFTALTERLAARGKAGAEEMGDYLDATFAALLDIAYEYGAGLVKWGGDATLLLFRDEGHTARAARAAWLMSQAMRRIGRLQTSVGRVTLRVSIGVDTGPIDLYLLGHDHRELLVVGSTASGTARMESIADAGEVAVSPAVATRLDPSCLGGGKDGAVLLGAAPAAAPAPARVTPRTDGLDVASLLPRAIGSLLATGRDEGAHRPVTAGFIQVSGLDALLATEGPRAAETHLASIIDRAQQSALTHRVTFLEWDVSADGGKVILIGGAPVAHGNDEERVLRAVKEVVAIDVSPLRLRGGVNCGRVYAGEFGPEFRRTWSVAGDAVNLAARLMAKAEAGRVLASGSVLERCGSQFTVTALEPFAVKGKAEPVTAYDVGEVRATRLDIDDNRLPLVGRDDELALLLDSAAALASGSGGLVDVVAEPGMGKTRLLAEAIERWGVPTLRVVCDEYEAAAPYLPVRRLLLGALDLPDDADEVDIGARLADVIASSSPLRPWAPLLDDVFGLRPSRTPEVDALEPKFRRPRLEAAVVDLLAALVPGATALVVEDVHVMDEASASVLARIAAAAGTQPWLVVVARRPVDSGFRPPTDGTCATLALRPLPVEATRRLAELAEDEEPLPPHEHSALMARSGGNPLFLRELIRARREAGSLEELPDSIEGLLHAQIDRLAPADQRLLRAAAVLGMRFDDALLANVVDDATLDPRVWQRLASFVVREGAVRRFSHGLVRDAAYEGLSFRRRRLLHLRAGRALEELPATGGEDRAGLLSLHFFHAGEYDEAWLYAKAAGDRASELYANVEAAELYERAIAAGRRLPEVGRPVLADVWESLGEVRYRLCEFEAADAAWLTVRRLTRSDSLTAGRIALKRSQIAALQSRAAQACRLLSSGRRHVAARDDVAARALDAQLTSQYGWVRYWMGDTRGAARWCTRAVDLAQAVDERRALASALMTLDAVDMTVGRFGVADTDVRAWQALRLFEELGDLVSQAKILNQLGYRAFYEGRWPDAITSYQRARDMSLRVGDAWNAAVYDLNAAEILVEQGHTDEAEQALRQVQRTLRASQAMLEAAFASALLARLCAHTGRFTEAEQLRDATRRDVGGADWQWSLQMDVWEAECLALQGRARDAIARADAAIAACAQLPGTPSELPSVFRVRGCALAQLGRGLEAQADLDTSLGYARELGALHEEAATCEHIARLGRGAADELSQAAARADALRRQLGVTRPLLVPIAPVVPAPASAPDALAIPEPRSMTATH